MPLPTGLDSSKLMGRASAAVGAVKLYQKALIRPLYLMQLLLCDSNSKFLDLSNHNCQTFAVAVPSSNGCSCGQLKEHRSPQIWKEFYEAGFAHQATTEIHGELNGLCCDKCIQFSSDLSHNLSFATQLRPLSLCSSRSF